jgi:RNA polymerase sigma-70 factor (ECF subfamily)
MADETQPTWQRFMTLLAPIHDAAAATARRLSGSTFDGDDLFQEAVLRAYRRLPTLRDPDRFRSWFFAILLNVHRNRTRRGFWRRFLPLDAVPGIVAGLAGEDGRVRAEERQGAERAARALATLPAEQREAVVLFDVDGYSIREIAVFQRVSESTTKSRLVRGRERLRRHYERFERLPAEPGAGPAPGEPDGVAPPEVGSA